MNLERWFGVVSQSWRSLARSTVLALLCVVLTATAVGAQSARSLTVASFGGQWESDLRAAMLEAFEKEYGVRINYVVGLSSEQLARIRAQQGRPQIDVVMLDDLLVAEAAQLGLLERLDPERIPNMKNLREAARIANDYGAGFTLSATVLMYNTDHVQEPPTSWEVLWDPQYRGRIAIPHVNTIWGLHTLMVAGRIYGDGYTDAVAGAQRLNEARLDNRATVYNSAAQLNTMAQQGHIWLAPFSSVWVNQLKASGVPVDIAIPDEGVYPIWTVWSVVKDAPNRDLAMEFVNYALSHEVQAAFAPRALALPAIEGVELDPDFRAMVDFPNFVAADEETVAAQRAEWIELWNRAMSGR